jgi:hypothetical protein
MTRFFDGEERRRQESTRKATATADPMRGQQESKVQGKDKSKSEMRGSLHCAAHDEAVSSFGRDDAVF